MIRQLLLLDQQTFQSYLKTRNKKPPQIKNQIQIQQKQPQKIADSPIKNKLKNQLQKGKIKFNNNDLQRLRQDCLQKYKILVDLESQRNNMFNILCQKQIKDKHDKQDSDGYCPSNQVQLDEFVDNNIKTVKKHKKIEPIKKRPQRRKKAVRKNRYFEQFDPFQQKEQKKQQSYYSNFNMNKNKNRASHTKFYCPIKKCHSTMSTFEYYHQHMIQNHQNYCHVMSMWMGMQNFRNGRSREAENAQRRQEFMNQFKPNFKILKINDQ